MSGSSANQLVLASAENDRFPPVDADEHARSFGLLSGLIVIEPD